VNGSPTFYATVATVLPLFVITLSAARRIGVKDGSETPGIDACIGISMLSAMAIGELSSIAALAGSPTSATLHSSELGVGLAGLLLFADLVWAQVTAHAKYERPTWQHRLVCGGGVLVIGVGGVLLVLTWIGDLF
jgi:hypothetical protein